MKDNLAVSGGNSVNMKPVTSAVRQDGGSTMAATKPCGKQAHTTNKGRQKTASVNEKDESGAEHVFRCCECAEEVGAESNALNCDRCGADDAWKCIGCMGISEKMYKALFSAESPLTWFCDKYRLHVFAISQDITGEQGDTHVPDNSGKDVVTGNKNFQIKRTRKW